MSAEEKMEKAPPLKASATMTASEAFVATNPETGLTDAEVEKSREISGWNEVPKHEVATWVIFLHQFMGFLPVLIEISAIISIAAGDWQDFVIIVAILVVNAILGFHEEHKAKKALDEMSNSLDSQVATKRNGETVNLPTRDLVPGDVILLVGGTIIPADTKWVSGDKMSIDTAALTGEPLPRKYPSKEYGDLIFSGTTVVAGECYGQIMTTGTNTEIGRAQADVLKDKSVRVVSVFAQKIMIVVQVLVISCLAFVVAVVLVLGIAYGQFSGWSRLGLTTKDAVLSGLAIMVASVPIALPLVLAVNLALGASFMAKEHHAIVTTIPALQDIASMSMLCSDKTGTLTTANMSIIPDRIFAGEGFSVDQVIMFAFQCSNPDKKDDPIDRAIVNAFHESSVRSQESEWEQKEIIGFNPTVKRVVAFAEHNGRTYTIAKGLPAKIIDTAAGAVDEHECQWKVEKHDDKEFITALTETDRSLSTAGYKTIAIAMCEGDCRKQKDSVWKFVGLMPMLDPPRVDTRATIESLHRANISVKMITGDHVNVGIETARLIGLGVDIRAGEEIRNAQPEDKKQLVWEADGFAAVLPSDKREAVQILRNEWGLVCGMTGDGVNDAPALSAAQVGIAVEGATDAACNAADLILTEPGLTPIYGAVLESRRIFMRIKAYVVYRVAASLVLVLVLSIVIYVTGCAVDSLAVIILALLNDISMIPVAYDNAMATTKPQIPDAKKLVSQSLFYGLVQAAVALGFIFVMNDVVLPYPVDLEKCDNQSKAFIWFELVMATELMIFSVRAPSFAFLSCPSIYLVGSVGLTCIGCFFGAVYLYDLSWQNLGWILLFNFIVFFFLDAAKMPFRDLIKDAPGDIITSDELVDVDLSKSEVTRNMEKKMRYVSHNESRRSPSDLTHMIEIRDERPTCWNKFKNFAGDIYPSRVTNGFINKRNFRNTPFTAPPASSMTMDSKYFN